MHVCILYPGNKRNKLPLSLVREFLTKSSGSSSRLLADLNVWLDVSPRESASVALVPSRFLPAEYAPGSPVARGGS